MALRLAAPGLASAVAALCIGLWAGGAAPAVMAAMHVVASNYFDRPFTDTSAVLGVMECYRAGVDIYVSNPCDVPWGRPHVYSSVWLLGARTSVTPAATMEVGTAMLAAFCSSLFLLPPARTGGAAVLLALAMLSNAVIFALFQANADIIIFVMTVVAAALLTRATAQRMGGYALILAAASLKFYPLTLMATALQERLRIFLIVTACSLVAFAAFVWAYGSDVPRAMKVVPTGWITQMTGATVIGTGLPIFPGGIRTVTTAPPLGTTGLLLTVLLSVACIVAAALVARTEAFGAAVSSLSVQERCFALLGCVTLVSCFFLGQNLRYRDVFVLMVLPAWANLAFARQRHRIRWLFGGSALLAVGLLWAVHVENGLDHALAALHVPDRVADMLVAAMWLARELCRWAFVTVMLASIFRTAADLNLVRRHLPGRLAW